MVLECAHLARFVLGNSVLGVLLALLALAVGPAGFGNVDLNCFVESVNLDLGIKCRKSSFIALVPRRDPGESCSWAI